MKDVLSQIHEMIDAAGPLVAKETVEFAGKKHEFHFRRLPFIEADRLRVSVIGGDGKFDGEKFAGNNARLVAATLVDGIGNSVASYDEVCLWPVGLVDKMAEAANKVNAIVPNAQELAVKNSAATADATS